MANRLLSPPLNGSVIHADFVIPMTAVPPAAAPATAPPEILDSAVGGCAALRIRAKAHFVWAVEDGAQHNYAQLGKRLAEESGDLFRNGEHGHGLVQVLPDGATRLISKASDLAPVIVDRIEMHVEKDGKVTSELPSAIHLNGMLRSESFLRQFQAIDQVTTTAYYMDDFRLVKPGYNDGGPGHRVLYVGSGTPSIAETTETINRFLDVMAFSSLADRTNAVAAALTVQLRRQWAGEKPNVLVTATKPHSGKGTLTEFFRASVPKADLLYESVDWPMQSQFQRQVRANPDIGVVIFDNVRLDSAGGRAACIRSGFIESFVTNAEISMAAPGAGESLSLRNHFVVTINTNNGALSPDLLTRSLPIHLAPKGDVHLQQTPIGNPKLEFLPANVGKIEAELRGMIQRWLASGGELDHTVKHPMIRWARTIGGILKANGYPEFLANYGSRKQTDEPVYEALGILGAARPNEPLKPMEWANLAVREGLARTLFSPTERDTPKGRERSIGVTLKRLLDCEFEGHTDVKWYRFRLEGGNRRWERGGNPHVRYQFTVLAERACPVDDDDGIEVGQ